MALDSFLRFKHRYVCWLRTRVLVTLQDCAPNGVWEKGLRCGILIASVKNCPFFFLPLRAVLKGLHCLVEVRKTIPLYLQKQIFLGLCISFPVCKCCFYSELILTETGNKTTTKQQINAQKSTKQWEEKTNKKLKGLPCFREGSKNLSWRMKHIPS